MNDLDIGQVSERTGLPASTLRYYEEQGLIRSIGRRGLRRQFAPDVVERVALISLGRATGFSLQEIALMFAPDGRIEVDRGKLAAKAQELSITIRRLRSMRDCLLHAAACPAPSHLECPAFRRLMVSATSGAIGKRRSRRGLP
ncbi:helix-turn-helix domain-containing protein [Inquilinus limosus]|uniref:MerR family transcriptional regulator n=1 Tax=Inquilinus limosus MP06 TaxID=1398085 RepID=A0A0A0D9Y8_9PROT|nr:helix-turn-helix domain-containing protein [Inquilinus limosus]KGM33782.1 MerR family transcriptional regulator [Inquilinus limosus MP06]